MRRYAVFLPERELVRWKKFTADCCAIGETRIGDVFSWYPLSAHQRRDPGHMSSSIRRFLKAERSGSVIFHPAVQESRIGTFSHRETEEFTFSRSYAGFGRRLLQCLKEARLETLSRIDQFVEQSWIHSIPDRRISASTWLSQFRLSSDYTWIGKQLLRFIDLWSFERVFIELGMFSEIDLHNYDVIALNLGNTAGKSSGILANRIRKLTEQTGVDIPIMDFKQAIECIEYTNILFVEDCLISGNEMCRVFLGLLNETNPIGSAKSLPLSDVGILSTKRITLRFAVKTDWGVEELRYFLEARGLQDCIHIDRNTGATYPVLSAMGRTEMAQRHRICDEQQNLVSIDLLNPWSFDNGRGWMTSEDAEDARKLCWEIGHQLMQQYSGNLRKSDVWISECALGVRSLGLSTIFAHSIPKSTLPIYWLSGKVEHCGVTRDWKPLFFLYHNSGISGDRMSSASNT